MFNVKQTIKPGVCKAMRCTNMTNKDTGLCEKHDAEWRAAGMPLLTTATSGAAKGASSDALATFPEERQQALLSERGPLTQILEAAQTFPLDTDERLTEAQGYVNAAHASMKALKEERDAVVKPIKAAVKKIEEWFKPNLDVLESIKNTFATRIGAEQQRRALAQREALKVIEANAGAAPAEAFIAAHADTTAPANSGGFTTRLEFTVSNFDALPPEYKILMADLPKIRQALDAGIREIPGVTVTETQVARVGRAA